jgi:transaldolase
VYLRDGTLGRLVADGIRGVTANPTIFARAIEDSDAGTDGFVSIEVAPELARYAEVIDAYLAGLETLAEGGGDLASVHSVASFFVSRVDTEVDRRLDAVGTSDALALRGQVAVAQAKLAYRLFGDRFADQRWERLAARGAQVQRPLWASTSTKDPSYPDTFYVDRLIGPDTVDTLPETTIAAFEDHGTLARTIDSGVDHAGAVMDRLAEVGVDMDDVGRTLEDQGVAGFHQSFAHVLQALEHKARQLAPR